MSKLRLSIGLCLICVCLCAGGPSAYTQTSGHYKRQTIAAGAMTNGTLTTFESVLSFKLASTDSLDPALLTWSTVTNDINMTSSFFREPLRALHSDEVECGEMWFGRALACKANNTDVAVATVVTKPMSVVYRYWLEQISKDFGVLRQYGGKSKGAAQFIEELEQAVGNPENEDSVWLKLRTAYCNEEPSGSYPDVYGTLRYCGGQK